MRRSTDKGRGPGLPYSAQIIGAVVKALDLDRGTLTSRTARRFFAGKPVSEKSQAEIFEALSEATIKLGFIPEPTVLRRFGTPMSTIVSEALQTTGERWDALLALIQSMSAPIHDYSIAVNGFLRLVVIDLALRIFALARLADLDPPTLDTPIWAMVNSQSRLLRSLVRDAGFTREQIADRLQVSDTTIDNWLDGKVRPTRRNLATLAEALADGFSDASASQIEQRIRRQLTLSHLADLLVPVIGREQLLELSTALYRFVRTISANVAQLERPPLEENPTAEVVAMMYGTAHTSTFPLIEDLALAETDPEWNKYIMVAGANWDAAFQRIVIEAGLPGTAAGLAQDISDVSPTASNHLGNDQSLIPAEEIRHRLMQEATIEDLPRIISGGTRGLTRTWENGIALRRGLVQDFPTNPESHFNLGSYLGKVGELTGRRDLIDEGIKECKIAALLLPEWDAPAVESAIILANFGAYKESLQELDWAKSVLPEPTPHLEFGFGYTLMMLERYDEALLHFKEVLKTKPDYALALRDAARCSFKLGDHNNGIRYSKKARRFGDPVEYELWRNGEYSKRRSRRKVD